MTKSKGRNREKFLVVSTEREAHNRGSNKEQLDQLKELIQKINGTGAIRPTNQDGEKLTGPGEHEPDLPPAA